MASASPTKDQLSTEDQLRLELAAAKAEQKDLWENFIDPLRKDLTAALAELDALKATLAQRRATKVVSKGARSFQDCERITADPGYWASLS